MSYDHHFEYMSLRDYSSANGISKNYDFYLNEHICENGGMFNYECESLTKILLSNCEIKSNLDFNVPLSSLFWLDTYSNIDGGDVVLSYVNRLLSDMKAEQIKRSDILLWHMRKFRYPSYMSRKEEDFFEMHKYTEEEVAEILRFVDRCPETVVGKAALICKDVIVYYDVTERERIVAAKKMSAWWTESNTSSNRLMDEIYPLLQHIADIYKTTGELLLPEKVAKELKRIRSAHFSFEDKIIEIKLKNVIENGLELSKERIIGIITDHSVILRKNFFANASATEENLFEPWEKKFHHSSVSEKDLCEYNDRMVQAIELSSEDSEQAKHSFQILDKTMCDRNLENQSLECRIFASFFYSNYGDFYMRIKDYCDAFEKYNVAVQLAEMVLNSDTSEKTYKMVAEAYRKISGYYKAVDNELNAEAYRKIALYYDGIGKLW